MGCKVYRNVGVFGAGVLPGLEHVKPIWEEVRYYPLAPEFARLCSIVSLDPREVDCIYQKASGEWWFKMKSGIAKGFTIEPNPTACDLCGLIGCDCPKPDVVERKA